MAEHNIDKWNFDKVISSLKEDSLVGGDYNDDEYDDPSIEDYLREDEQKQRMEKKSASENVPIVDDIDDVLLKQKAAQREYTNGIADGTISGAITEAAYVINATGCTEQQYEDRAKIIDMGTAMLEYDYNKIGEKRLATIASLPQEAREELLADFKNGEADPYFIDLARINSYAGAESESIPEPESEEASMLKEEEPSHDDSYQSFDSNYADDNPEDTEDVENNEQAIKNTEPQGNNEDETEEDWDDEPAADYTVDSSELGFSETGSDLSSASSEEETEEKEETDSNNNESEEIHMSEETEVNTVEEPEVQQTEQTEQTEVPASEETEAQTAPEVMEVKSDDSEEAPEEAVEEPKTVTTESGTGESEPPVTHAQETAEPKPQAEETEPVIEQVENTEEVPQRLGIMSVDSIRPMLDELDEYRTAILETVGSAVTEQSYQNMLRDMQNVVSEAEGIFNFYLSNALYPFRSFDGNE